MPSKPPLIADRYSSLVSPENRQQLAVIRERATSFASQRSTASNTSEFLEAHIQCVETQITYLEKSRIFLRESLESRAIEHSTWNEVMGGADSDRREIEDEYVILKRQKKIIREDLEDGLIKDTTFEDAYISVLTDKVMLTSTKVQKIRSQEKEKFDQSNFKKEVLKYYDAIRDDGDIYCPLTGAWHPEDLVKTAHIVPKSLESEELSYLFGVGDLMLREPRNGKSTVSKYE